jgi:hypothetical protein
MPVTETMTALRTEGKEEINANPASARFVLGLSVAGVWNVAATQLSAVNSAK